MFAWKVWDGGRWFLVRFAEFKLLATVYGHEALLHDGPPVEAWRVSKHGVGFRP